jgi:hypothetical protein
MTPTNTHRRLIALAAVAIAGCAAPVAAAHDRDHDGRPVIAPARGVGGVTGGELLAAAWSRAALTDDPYMGSCAPIARGVLLPRAPHDTGRADCTATRHTRLFTNFGTACFAFELPPGSTEADQLACALESDQAIQAINITVDGRESVNIVRRRFELVSPQTTVQLPPDNVFGVPAGPTTFTAHAWGAVVRNLPLGPHRITSELVVQNEVVFTRTVYLSVVPGGHSDDHYAADGEDHHDHDNH